MHVKLWVFEHLRYQYWLLFSYFCVPFCPFFFHYSPFLCACHLSLLIFFAHSGSIVCLVSSGAGACGFKYPSLRARNFSLARIACTSGCGVCKARWSLLCSWGLWLETGIVSSKLNFFWSNTSLVGERVTNWPGRCVCGPYGLSIICSDGCLCSWQALCKQ